MYKQDLALNNLQLLIRYKTQPNHHSRFETVTLFPSRAPGTFT